MIMTEPGEAFEKGEGNSCIALKNDQPPVSALGSQHISDLRHEPPVGRI